MSTEYGLKNIFAASLLRRVSANSFAEYVSGLNPETKKKDVVWFAHDDNRPLSSFAGIWTEFIHDPGADCRVL